MTYYSHLEIEITMVNMVTEEQPIKTRQTFFFSIFATVTRASFVSAIKQVIVASANNRQLPNHHDPSPSPHQIALLNLQGKPCRCH
jgi:hypothetical protein